MEKLKDRDLATYGFLGYPLLQAADILITRPLTCPWVKTRRHNVEITREVRDASTTFTAARRTSRRKWLGHRQAAERRCALSGEATPRSSARRQGRSAGQGRSHPAQGRCRRGRLDIGRHRAAAGAPQGHRQIGADGAGGAAHRGEQAARPRRREDEQELWQHHRHARGAGGGGRKIKRMPPTARVHRSDPAIRRSARCGSSIWCIQTPHQGMGGKGLQTAGIGCWTANQPVIDAIKKSRSRGASAPRPTSRTRSSALDRRSRHGACTHRGTRDDARCARGDGPGLLIRSPVQTRATDSQLDLAAPALGLRTWA